MEISGQAAFVTGGSSGLGATTARHLAGLGARVGLLDFNETDAEAVDAAIGAGCDALGQVPRIVVDRAGNPGFEVFDRTIKVNLYGTFNVMSHANRRMVSLDALESGERGGWSSIPPRWPMRTGRSARRPIRRRKARLRR